MVSGSPVMRAYMIPRMTHNADIVTNPQVLSQTMSALQRTAEDFFHLIVEGVFAGRYSAKLQVF